VRSPSVGAIARAGELLRGLSTAVQTYGLYPLGHPDRVGQAEGLVVAAARLRDAFGADPVVFRSRGRFYLDRTLLAWESLMLLRLAQTFEGAEVESLEFHPGLEPREMDAFVQVLVGERQGHQDLIHLSINHHGVPIPDGAGGEMAELLHSYAAGLELLRQTGARLVAGEPADLDVAHDLTEHFADQIAHDPAQALLLTTVKSHDEYTYHHMINVCVLSLALGHAIGLPREQVIDLGIGALLHDVGKVKVPKEILQSDGPLNEEQWRLVQQHPVDGAGLILTTSGDVLHPAVTVVLEHHAAYDASGYPTLRGRRQPTLPSRLVQVVDCFDAVTSTRPYRKAEERRQALAILQAGAGRGFDPRVVRAFVRMMGLFPIGSMVELTGGEVGVVVDNHERQLSRPVVRLVLDEHGSPSDPIEVDLAQTSPNGEFRWAVARSLAPEEVGIDMLSFLATDGLVQPQPSYPDDHGLLHEPSPGEPAPPGYVEADPHTGLPR
jgi:HD-GYP domain-containing protein (c-di-GMP phosphodiesterase class II)